MLSKTIFTAPSKQRHIVFAQALMVCALLLCGVLAGCSGLPQDVERPVSRAFSSPQDTALGALIEERRQAQGTRHHSGFMLLNGPQAAYGSRLALVESAQKTIDLQYYAIHADSSTERLLTQLVEAARRGVRVRVLLDDFHTTGQNAQVMRLAFEPNIEMRMFNPVAGVRASKLGRIISALADFSRAQQRMHNKLFIADNAAGVAGGRNLGDAYFGNANSGNFVDLDVLAVGTVVQDLSRTFDAYWNNQRAYPVQSLVTKEQLNLWRSHPMAKKSDEQAAEGNAEAAEDASAPTVPAQEEATSEQRARIWDNQPLDLHQAKFIWAPALVLVDKPGKIPAESSAVPDAALPAAAQGMQALPAQTIAIASSLPAAGATASDTQQPGDTVVDGLLQLMSHAQHDLLIISPYFVPGPDMKDVFATARKKGVRVRVLTNSLASNDAPLAHAGYARHRPDLLSMGVQLYEMRSELTGLRSALSTGSGTTGSSRAMLHSKIVVIDGQLVAIGSMNLDVRSQLQNTEIALLIRSIELANKAIRQIEAALREAAWHVDLSNAGLVWRAPSGSGLQDTHSEPDASVPLQLLLKMLGPFAPDHLL